MRFRILGPLEVWDNGRWVALGPQQRALLAVLLMNANRVVSADRLIEHLWGDRPLPTARALLQGCVAQLRRALRTDDRQPLMTRAPGYLLEVPAGDLDLNRFEELAAEAGQVRAEGTRTALERASALLGEALLEWRGPALDGIAVDACQDEAARLEERRLAVFEDRVDVEVRLGRAVGLVAELRAHVGANPLRERPWAQLMLALYAAGRRADALAAYRQVRQTLVEQLGVEPGATLRNLHGAILSGADILDGYEQQRPEPAAPQAMAPAQLPAAPTAFTGRDQDLMRLDELLADVGDTRTIGVISGTAGVGKTALAVQWAHRVRDRFVDGQLHVNLCGYAQAPPVRPIEALAGFLLALGVPSEQTPVDLEQAAAMYRTLLADRRLLVVLDNARSAEQVRPLLPGGPGCLVLVTSRDRLGGLVARDGAAHLTLDVLGAQEAATLIARIVGPQRTHGEASAIAELAHLCGGLPLALRIAAANLALHPQRSIALHVAELATGNRLGGLAVDGDEHSAVRAAFDLSYAALDPEARRLFRRLGVAPVQDVTAEAAVALTNATPEVAGRLLDRLAGAHLLDEHTTGRYAMHDLLRLYAVERAYADDPTGERRAAAGRLYGWYLHAIDAAARLLYPEGLRLDLPPSDTDDSNARANFDEPAEALSWLEAERPNLLATVQHCAEHGPREVAWLLADALRGYYWLRMYPVEWLAVARAGLKAATAAGNLRAQAATERGLADAHMRQGQFLEATEHYTRALALSEQVGWPHAQCAALNNLGSLYRRLRRLTDAADSYKEALAINRRNGWLAGQAANLGNLGVLYGELGRLPQAADHLAEALALYRRLGSRGKEAVALGVLGEVAQMLGQLDQAADHFIRALALQREVVDRSSETDSLRVLAAVHRDAGRYSQAIEFANAAVALACDIGEPGYQPDALNTVGSIYLKLNQYERALDRYEEALRLAGETETPHQVAALAGMALAYRQLGRLDCAAECATGALARARHGGYWVLEGLAHTALADVHLARDLLDEAVEHARRAVAIHREAGHRLGEARALLLLGHARHRAGQADVAHGHWNDALELFADIGAPEADEVRTLLRCPRIPR